MWFDERKKKHKHEVCDLQDLFCEINRWFQRQKSDHCLCKLTQVHVNTLTEILTDSIIL